MKTMCPPGYHHSGFVATHALGHMMYGCVHELSQSHCGDNREGTWYSVFMVGCIYVICSQKNRQCALLVITNPPMAP